MDEKPTISDPSPIRAGVAASVLAHLALVGVVLLLAEVRPFADVPEQRIEVEVVTTDEAPPVPETKPEPKPEIKPTLDLPEFKPTAETKPAAPAAQQPPSPPEPQKSQPAKPEPKQKAEAAKPPEKSEPAKPEPQKAEPQQQAAPTPPHPQAAAAPFPPAIAQEPDITVKYAVSLGLPTDPTFDAPAETVADISADAVAALRKRLKSCAALPASVAPSDNVRIILRVALQPDGRLAQAPILIEASASVKGPALMKGAMDALAACQPYTMLPADKYKEWKVLDIGFTPQDFRGG